jgi:hypothetical protein
MHAVFFQPTIPADPPVVYHATVVPPAKFIEQDDADALKNHLGKPIYHI